MEDDQADHSDLSDSDQDEDFSQTDSTPGLATILDRLRAPRQSDLARKQKVPSNPPPKGQKRCKGPVVEKYSPASRVKQFPGEALSVERDKLFCSACYHLRRA